MSILLAQHPSCILTRCDAQAAAPHPGRDVRQLHQRADRGHGRWRSAFLRTDRTDRTDRADPHPAPRNRQRLARIAAGTSAPRRSAGPRRSPTAGRPRPPSKLPYKFGWLLPLVSDANGDRSQCHHLLRAPEMAAPLAAAPAATSRPLRPLCWMLRLSPPAILASPRAAPPQPSPPPPPPAARAASPPAPPPCACGPPLPAGAGPWRLHVHIVPLSEP